MKQTRKKHTDEFRKSAVELITKQGYSIAEAARDLGVNASRFITASGPISPDLALGDFYIHLYTDNDLQNDSIEFSNINLEITG